jgi:hypothetical protein
MYRRCLGTLTAALAGRANVIRPYETMHFGIINNRQRATMLNA